MNAMSMAEKKERKAFLNWNLTELYSFANKPPNYETWAEIK